MGDRSSYPPGTFSWVDLATTDPADAKRFYGGLFGWGFNDVPTGNGFYSMAQLGGRDAAAIGEQQPDERNQGIPPHWNSYVTVADADATAENAGALGGNVIVPAFDVLDVGRMSVVADPTGAVFSIWQPKTNIGAGVVNEPGALTWNELGTTDVEKAKAFYHELFDWSYEDMGGGAYTVIRVGQRTNGGIRPQTEQEKGVPPNWLPYFAVASCDESAAGAGELGGNVLVPPMDVPVSDGQSRFAVIADPQGAVFALFAGPLDD
jgi:predicted enzyme related to lactoylglutathione lyase